LGVVARAKGMSQLARECGLSREALSQALTPDGDPKFSEGARNEGHGARRLGEATPPAPIFGRVASCGSVAGSEIGRVRALQQTEA
jgi:hypothetical protein